MSVIPFAYNHRQCKLIYYEKSWDNEFLGKESTHGGNSTCPSLNCGDGFILTWNATKCFMLLSVVICKPKAYPILEENKEQWRVCKNI